MTRGAHTKRSLAKRLTCSPNDVYAVADQRGIPYDERHGVDKDGRPITHRRYDKAATEEYLLERARVAARRVAS